MITTVCESCPNCSNWRVSSRRCATLDDRCRAVVTEHIRIRPTWCRPMSNDHSKVSPTDRPNRPETHVKTFVNNIINYSLKFLKGFFIKRTTQASFCPSSYPAHIISEKIFKSIPRVRCHFSHSLFLMMGTSTFCSNRVPYRFALFESDKRAKMNAC